MKTKMKTGMKIERLDELYFYEDNTIYQVRISDTTDWHDGIFFDKFQNANNLDCHITHEYHFDEKNRPLKVICHLFGLKRNEEYNWKNDDVAFVREHSYNHIMIKDGKKDILCVGQLAEADADNCITSYQSQGYICTDNYTTRNSNQLQHSTLDIQYSLINDMNGKATEYYELLIDGEKYIVFFNYVKPPKDFSYKKAKEIYKNEIMNAIEKQISQLDFKVKTVGIQYGNYGYSITEPYLGFEANENNDVQSMTYAFEYAVTADNRETIAALDDYIKAQGYYNAFRKLMVSIKKELAEKCQVKVVLDEIAD